MSDKPLLYQVSMRGSVVALSTVLQAQNKLKFRVKSCKRKNKQ